FVIFSTGGDFCAPAPPQQMPRNTRRMKTGLTGLTGLHSNRRRFVFEILFILKILLILSKNPVLWRWRLTSGRWAAGLPGLAARGQPSPSRTPARLPNSRPDATSCPRCPAFSPGGHGWEDTIAASTRHPPDTSPG